MTDGDEFLYFICIEGGIQYSFVGFNLAISLIQEWVIISIKGEAIFMTTIFKEGS